LAGRAIVGILHDRGLARYRPMCVVPGSVISRRCKGMRLDDFGEVWLVAFGFDPAA
jgi:hypothetical protein